MAKNAQFSPELNYSFGAVMPETEFFIKTARAMVFFQDP
jgi:hypothetical protein